MKQLVLCVFYKSKCKYLSFRKKKVGKYNNDDSDIDEAGYEDIIKEEKKSRVIGLIEDLREEKYIKREKKIEEK